MHRSFAFFHELIIRLRANAAPAIGSEPKQVCNCLSRKKCVIGSEPEKMGRLRSL